MPHLGPDDSKETAIAHSSNKLDRRSAQDQSNRPEKESIQDHNLNMNVNKKDHHGQSTCAPGTDKTTDTVVCTMFSSKMNALYHLLSSKYYFLTA